MPVRIILVHDDPRFVRTAAAAIRAAGFDVAAFTDPLTALQALQAAPTVELLVTRVQFPLGKPHGISLARVARNKRSDLNVLFLSMPQHVEHVVGEGVGAYMVMPVSMPDLVEAVRRLLMPDEQKVEALPFAGRQ